MFNALKKLVGNENATAGAAPAGAPTAARIGQPAAIDRNLQKMFAKGVHYNSEYIHHYYYCYYLFPVHSYYNIIPIYSSV